MKIKNSWLVLVSIVAILILTSSVFFIYSRPDVPLENQSQSQPEVNLELKKGYPPNLLEGVITSIEINQSEGKFKIEVNLDPIFQEKPSFTREVTVLITENTKLSVYNFEVGVETKMDIESFKEGDGVVVAVKEENAEILTRDMYTGASVKKMILP